MDCNDSKSVFRCELYTSQINELKHMKIDLEQLKNELTMAQTKYQQRLYDYEMKLEQLYAQVDLIRVEQDEKETNLLNATAEWLDIKTKLESTAISPKQKVKLNVGGSYFETTIETLTRFTLATTTMSYFKTLFSRQWQLENDPKDDSIFIDRDGYLFGFILQYLRTGKLAIDPKCDLLRRDLIIEAQFYDLNGLVELLDNKRSKEVTNMISDQQLKSEELYSRTKILSTQYQEQLNKLFGCESQQWQLIYSASRDGYTAEAFHGLCDGRWPTMTVIRSVNGCIFGGFTTVAWNSTNEIIADTMAFLFTLKNPHQITATKYPVQEGKVRFAVSHSAKDGPTFGSVHNGGVDLLLQSPFNGFGNRTFFPHSYQDTTKKDRFTFTGDPYFACADVEIFCLN